jgi:ABC-type phosphate/phosphonate transport system ATPase subunit
MAVAALFGRAVFLTVCAANFFFCLHSIQKQHFHPMTTELNIRRYDIAKQLKPDAVVLMVGKRGTGKSTLLKVGCSS